MWLKIGCDWGRAEDSRLCFKSMGYMVWTLVLMLFLGGLHGVLLLKCFDPSDALCKVSKVKGKGRYRAGFERWRERVAQYIQYDLGLDK